MLDHDLGHLCFGRRIQMSGHSDFGFFFLEHLPFLPARPAHLAAVICAADDPYSVNTAYDPVSSFTMAPRSTIRPLYFWYFGSNSAFLR